MNPLYVLIGLGMLFLWSKFDPPEEKILISAIKKEKSFKRKDKKVW